MRYRLKVDGSGIIASIITVGLLYLATKELVWFIILLPVMLLISFKIKKDSQLKSKENTNGN